MPLRPGRPPPGPGVQTSTTVRGGAVFSLAYIASELRRRRGRTLLTALGLGLGVGLGVELGW